MRAIVLFATAALLAGIAPANASVVSLGSTNAEACYRAADARNISALAKQACDTALSQDALSLDDRSGTHVNRGILWMISGDLARANRDFDRALVLDPRQGEAWLNKAVAQLKVGNSRLALEMANRALVLRTKRPAIAYYIRGVAYEDSGNLRAAYADLTRARDLAPKWSVPAMELSRYQIRSR